MIYNLLDFRLLVPDANPTLGGDGVFPLWVLRVVLISPKGKCTIRDSRQRGTASDTSKLSALSALSARDKKSVQIIHKISCPSGHRSTVKRVDVPVNVNVPASWATILYPLNSPSPTGEGWGEALLSPKSRTPPAGCRWWHGTGRAPAPTADPRSHKPGQKDGR